MDKELINTLKIGDRVIVTGDHYAGSLGGHACEISREYTIQQVSLGDPEDDQPVRVANSCGWLHYTDFELVKESADSIESSPEKTEIPVTITEQTITNGTNEVPYSKYPDLSNAITNMLVRGRVGDKHRMNMIDEINKTIVGLEDERNEWVRTAIACSPSGSAS